MPNVTQTYSNSLLSNEELQSNVLTAYNLKGCIIYQIKFKDTEKQRAVYKLKSGEDFYCLKKLYYQKEDLLFVYSAIEWLYHFNLNVPRILKTVNKNRYVTYKDMLFILTPWIEGEKCNYDNINHVLKSALVLSKIHSAGENFYPILGSSKRIGYENIYLLMNRHFNQFLYFSNSAFKYGDNFSKIFIENFDSYMHLTKIAVKSASEINFNNLRSSLCHLDYVNKNIIFDDKGNLWIIDFDKCKIDYCVHDISYFLRRFLKRENTNWNLELLLKCLETYEKDTPLNKDEYLYILSYLSFPQKHWKLARDYYNNINVCNKQAFTSLLEKASRNLENQIEMIDSFASIIDKKHY
ncbi:MAG: CotS family spore coat protein [Clostridium sp.]|nr:CotS family spore coat protein [Clostridium sp.]